MTTCSTCVDSPLLNNRCVASPYQAWHGAEHINYLCILQLIVGQVHKTVMGNHNSIEIIMWSCDTLHRTLDNIQVVYLGQGCCKICQCGRYFPHSQKSICQQPIYDVVDWNIVRGTFVKFCCFYVQLFPCTSSTVNIF